MPNLAKIRALLKDAPHTVSINVGRNIGSDINALRNPDIEKAIMSNFPGATITKHDVIPPQPGSKFGPFEHTSRVTFEAPRGNIAAQTHSLSTDLKQDAIPALNHTTGESVLAGPKAQDWGGKFDKSYFVHPGDNTSFGNRQQAFKDEFTGGFYHGSSSPNIKAFDPLKNTDPMKLETPGVTFATRDPDFAESFLPGSERGGYKAGATMYPVSINLGKHWHPNQPESQQVVEDYLKKMYPHEANPDDLKDIKKDMLQAKWTDIENPNFLQHLRDTGHDTFHVMEGGIPNVGVFEPQNIRGKFAAFNPEDAASPEIMKASGGSVEGYAGGGKIEALKQLAHAVTVPFTHFSPQEALTTLDPRRYGTGMKGAEAARLSTATDIAPRSYFYHGENIVPESGVGGNKYTGVSQNSYPWSKDPANFYEQSRTNDPYLAQMGITQHSPEHTITNMERNIKNAGYSGYHTDTGTGVLFNDTPVTKAQ